MKKQLQLIVRKTERISFVLKLFLIIAFFNVNSNVNAQSINKDDVVTIYEFREAVNLSKSTNHTYSLNKLCMGIVPSILIKNNVLEYTTPSKPALRIITDIASINKLYENNSSYNSVEVIVIQINDLSEFNNLEILTSLAHLSNLEYIYFSCSFELCNNVSNEIECEKLKIGSKIKRDLIPIIIYSSEQSK